MDTEACSDTHTDTDKDIDANTNKDTDSDRYTEHSISLIYLLLFTFSRYTSIFWM